MNNIDLANFDKMLELAEFGAKQHNERRQIAFRISISYVTLLVLILYQTIKNNERVLEFHWLSLLIVSSLLLLMHLIYLQWQWTTQKASINDVRRRDFYLKKAESFSYHLSRNPFSGFNPDPSQKGYT